jgi:hypothetical protein
MRLVIHLVFFFCLSGKVLAAGQVDSTRNSKLAILAKKMHLKEPKLKAVNMRFASGTSVDYALVTLKCSIA